VIAQVHGVATANGAGAGACGLAVAADSAKMELTAINARLGRGTGSKSPIAVQIAKKSFYTADDMVYHKTFDYMNEAFASLCSEDNAGYGACRRSGLKS
jgi:hypothetical protein